MAVLIFIVVLFSIMTYLSKCELAKQGQPRSILSDIEIIMHSLCFQFSMSEAVNMKKLSLYNWIRILTLIAFFTF